MKGILALLFSHLLLGSRADAGSVRVNVGDAGCTGRQVTIINCWKKLPGVSSIEVLPRQPKSPGGQRIFVITSDGTPPNEAELRKALGRRAKNFPISSCVNDDARK
jgi:hypothetical protein